MTGYSDDREALAALLMPFFAHDETGTFAVDAAAAVLDWQAQRDAAGEYTPEQWASRWSRHDEGYDQGSNDTLLWAVSTLEAEAERLPESMHARSMRYAASLLRSGPAKEPASSTD